MGRYLSQAPRVKKQQVFTVSGTFTPSPGLLAAGGVVEVRCVGGGGGGAIGHMGPGEKTVFSNSGGGGSGADITRIVTITGPVTVLVGAGGTGGAWTGPPRTRHEPTDGGTTSFGNLVVAPGGKSGGKGINNASAFGGGAGGPGGFHGEHYMYEYNTTKVGGNGGGPGGGLAGRSNMGPVHQTFMNGLPNSGGGGGGGGSGTEQDDGYLNVSSGHGGSGICIVKWEE